MYCLQKLHNQPNPQYFKAPSAKQYFLIHVQKSRHDSETVLLEFKLLNFIFLDAIAVQRLK